MDEKKFKKKVEDYYSDFFCIQKRVFPELLEQAKIQCFLHELAIFLYDLSRPEADIKGSKLYLVHIKNMLDKAMAFRETIMYTDAYPDRTKEFFNNADVLLKKQLMPICEAEVKENMEREEEFYKQLESGDYVD